MTTQPGKRGTYERLARNPEVDDADSRSTAARRRDGDSQNVDTGKPRMKLDAKTVIGLFVSAALLWWLFRDQDLGALSSHIAAANLFYLAAAVAVSTAGYLIRAVRWRILLRPMSRMTALRSRWAAVNVGFMVNNVIGGRIPGEVARAYAIGRLEGIDASGAFASLVTERLLDAVALLTLLAFALASPAFPAGATVGGQGIASAVSLLLVVLGVALAGLALMLVRPALFAAMVGWLLKPLPERWRRPVLDGLTSFIQGLDTLRRPADLLAAFVWSLVLWTWLAWSFWLTFRAFGLDLGMTAAVFTQCAVAVFVALPAAPAMIGTFHAGVTVSMSEVFGATTDTALAVAITYHVTTLLPVTLIGLWYAWGLGLTVRKIPRETVNAGQ